MGYVSLGCLPGGSASETLRTSIKQVKDRSCPVPQGVGLRPKLGQYRVKRGEEEKVGTSAVETYRQVFPWASSCGL